MIVGGALTGGQLASFAMYTMSVSSGITATMKVYSRIMEVEENEENEGLGFGSKSTCI